MNIEEDRSGILYDVNKMIRDIECPPVSYRVSEEDALILLKKVSAYLIGNEPYDEDDDKQDIIDSIDSVIRDLEDTKEMIKEIKHDGYGIH